MAALLLAVFMILTITGSQASFDKEKGLSHLLRKLSSDHTADRNGDVGYIKETEDEMKLVKDVVQGIQKYVEEVKENHSSPVQAEHQVTTPSDTEVTEGSKGTDGLENDNLQTQVNELEQSVEKLTDATEQLVELESYYSETQGDRIERLIEVLNKESEDIHNYLSDRTEVVNDALRPYNNINNPMFMPYLGKSNHVPRPFDEIEYKALDERDWHDKHCRRLGAHCLGWFPTCCKQSHDTGVEMCCQFEKSSAGMKIPYSGKCVEKSSRNTCN